MFDGRLETFVKVAECGSFTKAADALFVTPTAVMKQINALEKELSVLSPRIYGARRAESA